MFTNRRIIAHGSDPFEGPWVFFPFVAWPELFPRFVHSEKGAEKRVNPLPQSLCPVAPLGMVPLKEPVDAC